MEFEKRPPKTYKIFGKDYTVTVPTVGQMEVLMAEKSKLDEVSQVTFVVGWLETLGLPKNTSKDLYLDQLTAIIEDLTASKKK